MKINRASNRPQRKGAAFLILIVMVLLVVVGATQVLVRSELTTRRSESDRRRVRSMVTAIDAMQRIADDSNELNDSIRLPLDVSTKEFIEVTINEEKSHITARWVKGDQVIDEMRQEIRNNVEPSE